MPKQKTNSSAKKRFKLSGTGKLMRKKAFHSHILTKKSKDIKKRLVEITTVHQSDENNIKKLLRLK